MSDSDIDAQTDERLWVILILIDATRSTASVCSLAMKPWMMKHTVTVIDPVVNERSDQGIVK